MHITDPMIRVNLLICKGQLQPRREIRKVPTSSRDREWVLVTINTVLLLIFLLQIKHMFADYFLQTPKMLSGRGEYWHVGRAQHAGIHAVGSAVVFAVMGTNPLFILLICTAEWVVHFNIDFWKASYSDRNSLAPDQAAFWRAAGFDQALHQATYLAMAWAWASFA